MRLLQTRSMYFLLALGVFLSLSQVDGSYANDTAGIFFKDSASCPTPYSIQNKTYDVFYSDLLSTTITSIVTPKEFSNFFCSSVAVVKKIFLFSIHSTAPPMQFS